MQTLPLAERPMPTLHSMVVCSVCNLELRNWQVHLLKAPACPACSGELEINAILHLQLADDFLTNV